MHFPASWQTLAKETPADIPLLSCSSIVKFCCLRNKSALYDLGAGLYAVQSVENHACRCGPEGRDRPPDLITQAVLNAIESTGLRGAGGVRVGPAGQELLQAEELRGPELHDGPLATSGRSGRACKSCRDCSAVEQHSRPHQCCRFLLDRRQVSHSSAAAAAAAAAAAMQAPPVQSVAGPTALPGQLAAQAPVQSVTPAAGYSVHAGPQSLLQQQHCRPHQRTRFLLDRQPRQDSSPPNWFLLKAARTASGPGRAVRHSCSSSTPGRTWFLLDRQPRQDSSPPKHPGSHSLLQQHSRTRAPSSWTDSPRLGRTPNGGAVGDLQKPAEDREVREEEAGSFGLMPHHK